MAETHGVAQVVVDPNGTLESDEVPVTTSTHNGNMDATKADFRLLANASEEVTTIDEKQVNCSLVTWTETRKDKSARQDRNDKSSAQASPHRIDCCDRVPNKPAQQSSVLVTETETPTEKQANLDTISNEA